MGIEANLVKAFTKDKDQGNPAGVILNADGLTDKRMLEIAGKLGFSESVFIQESDKADYRFRFFSRKQEVGLCAHATIAGAYLLSEGRFSRYDIETRSGIIAVVCHEDGLVTMDQKKPEFIDYKVRREDIAELLRIDESDIQEYPLQIVSTGTPKLMIPVRSLEVLFNIRPNMEGIKDYCEKTGARGFYPFTSETKENSDFHARQFNPLSGIDEDPITGVAAGALGAYMAKNKLSSKKRFLIEQGYIMNKAGKIFVDVSEGVKVGGYAVTYGKKPLE
ncbi:MAG: PhzF family phenazine biosynthesis protein [Candidatus Woesearchaeota archaeon]